MADSLSALLGLVIAGLVLWVRDKHVRRQWLRVTLLIVAVFLALPAINWVYIAAKQGAAGFLDGLSGS